MHQGPKPKRIHQTAIFFHQVYIHSNPSGTIWITNLWGQCFDATHFRAAHVPNCRFRWLQQGSLIFVYPKKMCRHFWGTLGPINCLVVCGLRCLPHGYMFLSRSIFWSIQLCDMVFLTVQALGGGWVIHFLDSR
jgi:hypothetical protein